MRRPSFWCKPESGRPIYGSIVATWYYTGVRLKHQEAAE